MADEVKEKQVTEPKKKAKPVKKAVKFYFPKSAKKSYRKEGMHVKAENHIYILDPSNPKYDEILEYMRNHKENKVNGGRSFVEISADTKDSARGDILDTLIQMDVTQIRKACGGDMEYERISSKGQLIDIYLKQQDL